MIFNPSSIPEVLVIEPDMRGDHRGHLMETFRADLMARAGITATFVQDNHTRSRRGVLRGLHYQIQHAQGKLIRVAIGEIFDVAVDLRRGSKTFGRWIGETLSAENRKMIWIPPAFAHGFIVLSDEADVLYKATDYYAPEFERTLAWNDPAIGIRWPLVSGESPILSAKDASGLMLSQAEVYD